ncbi:hypothetical protein EGR_01847 [Echinococcus granulosus]|uniref:Uncharacterized protein n=1 Tax=Echinococcus granulosus TaxID=6210 RepID=W6URP0_ECHGR|nr:hypothetical protein EGR_01847 [Echinococcus granulosus]EUB63356.1 hypothetical protein EGR_01847 [Echinococcus granulosus]
MTVLFNQSSKKRSYAINDNSSSLSFKKLSYIPSQVTVIINMVVRRGGLNHTYLLKFCENFVNLNNQILRFYCHLNSYFKRTGKLKICKFVCNLTPFFPYFAIFVKPKSFGTLFFSINRKKRATISIMLYDEGTEKFDLAWSLLGQLIWLQAITILYLCCLDVPLLLKSLKSHMKKIENTLLNCIVIKNKKNQEIRTFVTFNSYYHLNEVFKT